MQIDWISAITATPPELWPGYTSGERVQIGPDGRLLKRSPSLHQVTDDSDPSSSRNFTVWTPNPGTLYLSGNPVKLLQGHNLWGSTDATALFLEAGAFVRQRIGHFPGPESWQGCKFSPPRFTRLDVTRSYRFPTQADADDYIRYIAGNARSRHGAANLVGGTTAYFGQHSRRWSLKVYAKSHELLEEAKRYSRRSLRYLMPRGGVPAELYEWARGVVRFELTLRGPEIGPIDHKLMASDHVAWAATTWQHYFDRITFSENTTMNTQHQLHESTLPGRLQGVLALWRSGADLRAVYSRPSFYRIRQEIIKAAGIDVSVPPSADAPPTARAQLDPAGWDPEPIESRTVNPRDELRRQYGLV